MHTLVDDAQKIFCDAFAFERHHSFTININRRHRVLSLVQKANSDVGEFDLARPVDHALHHGHTHLLNPLALAALQWHLMLEIILCFLGKLLKKRLSFARTLDRRHHRRE